MIFKKIIAKIFSALGANQSIYGSQIKKVLIEPDLVVLNYLCDLIIVTMFHSNYSVTPKQNSSVKPLILL